MNLDAKKLRELITYSFDGAFYLNRAGVSYRRLFPDEEGYLKFTKDGVKYKLKANQVAIVFVTGNQLKKNECVMHRNLVKDDFRFNNLCVLPRSAFNKVKEAYRNLSGQLQLQPHPTDAFAYVLCWRENGANKSKVVQDIVTARHLYTKLQLKYAKILNSYCIFD